MIYYLAYFLLIVTSLILCVILVRNNNTRFLPLMILLMVTLLIEVLAGILTVLKIDFVWAYHLYSPIEFLLLSAFLSYELKNWRLQVSVKICVILFSLFSLFISIFFYRFRTMPGINIGVESILIFLLSTYRLFNLEVNDDKPIFFKTDFWICTGLLLFFGVCSFFFGIYTPLFKLSSRNAFMLFGAIVAPFNLMLYSFIIIGLLCSIQKKKFTSP